MSKLSGLGRALSLLSVAFGGMGRDYPKYILESQGERLVLPVTPDNYSLTNGQDNKVINITQVGEALLFGNPKLGFHHCGCSAAPRTGRLHCP